MDKELLKKLLVPELEKLQKGTYIIYGTREIGNVYCDVISELFGEDAVAYFLDGSPKAMKSYRGRPVIGLGELEKLEIETYHYMIASISDNADKMAEELLKMGVPKQNIYNNILYFKANDLRRRMGTCKNIYLYEPFSSIKELETWITETGYYLDYHKVPQTFYYFCGDVQEGYQASFPESIHVVSGAFSGCKEQEDVILVRDVNHIEQVREHYSNPVLCVDDNFILYIRSLMYIAINDEIPDRTHYEDHYRANLERLLVLAENRRGVLICGNGPSLEEGAEKHKEVMDQLLTVVCNNLYQVHDLMDILKPTCYILSDTASFQVDTKQDLEQIVQYVNHHDCYLIIPKKWEDIVIKQCSIHLDKLIGLEFATDEINVPGAENLKTCVGGTVVLTMGVPIGLACKRDLYFMGCDGTKILEDIDGKEWLWGYQKGINLEWTKNLSEKGSFIGFNKNVERSMLELGQSYSRLLALANQQGNQYYTLTHSNFEILEKHYVDQLPAKERVILFGAGGGGGRLLSQLKEEYHILCFLDNDKNKNGTELKGLKVYTPSADLLADMEYDSIIISSVVGMEEIMAQLSSYGIPLFKMNTRYVEAPIVSRNTFCKNLGELFGGLGLRGACAEAGVFQGSFAKEINKNFPNKKLYLFDTFEGFDKRDVETETENHFSSAKQADYNNTSEEMVLEKMPYPEKCIIKKGFFPETAKGITEEFCFVNLDLDLYTPTLEGLRWFSPRMVKGGVILIHDYFTADFKGVKEAVVEFMKEAPKGIGLSPIGDGMSILLYGF